MSNKIFACLNRDKNTVERGNYGAVVGVDRCGVLLYALYRQQTVEHVMTVCPSFVAAILSHLITTITHAEA